MMRRHLCLLLLLAPLSASQAAPKIFKCKNANGEVFYSQVYDATKCGGGGSEISEHGVAVRTIDRIKTPEELAAEKVIAEQEAEAARIEEARRRADEVLAISYPSEDDLKRGFDEEIEAIDSTIESANLSIRSHQKSLAQWLAVAAEAERANKPVPDDVSANISMVRGHLQEQRALIAKGKKDKVKAKARFDDRLARYREIKSRQEKHLQGE